MEHVMMAIGHENGAPFRCDSDHQALVSRILSCGPFYYWILDGLKARCAAAMKLWLTCREKKRLSFASS